jgi:hypothetical protein
MPPFDEAADDRRSQETPIALGEFRSGRYWARTSDLLLVRQPTAAQGMADLLGIPRLPVLVERAKARITCRDFSGRWSTEVDAWTSGAASRPRVLLGASAAPRR